MHICEARSGVSWIHHFKSGVVIDLVKIENMVHWPKPKNVKALKGFLGLIEYYRRFVRDYGKINRPLIDMLKRNSFQWTEKWEHPFRQLKKAMITTQCWNCPNSPKVLSSVMHLARG